MEFTFDFIRIFGIGLLYVAPVLIALASLITLGGLVIGKKEGWSGPDAIYYAFITATTVGYGDFYPKKRLSKNLAILITITGMVFTGIIVGVGLNAISHAFKQMPAAQQLTEEFYQ